MQDNIENYLNGIAENFKLLRKKSGLTQEQLAEKLDCSREFINRIENRKENLSLKMLLLFSLVLKIHPKDIFNFD